MNLQGRDLERGHTGHDVSKLHEELVELGFDVALEEREAGRFGETTLAAVRALQVEWSVEVTGKIDEKGAKALREARRRHTWVISGLVTSAAHVTVGRLAVAIIDRNVGADEPVASGSTDDAGSYRIRALIPPATLRRRHKTAPDLQARISSHAAEGKETFLAASEVAWNAARAVVLDVVLPAGTTALPSEYETLVEAIAALYPGQLSKLQETPKQQDLTFLAAKTGWDARALAMAALAAQLSETVTVPQLASCTVGKNAKKAGVAVPAPVRLQPAFYYALLRAGAPANAQQIFQMSAVSAAAVWTQAIDQGVIPVNLESGIDSAKNDFQLLATNRVLSAPAGASTLPEQVGQVLTTALEQSKFASLVSQYIEDPSGFWAEVKTQFPAQVDQLQLLGRLNYLTLNNATLANALSQVLTPEAGGTGDLTKLVSAGLYEPAAWAQHIGGSVPAGIPGATPAEQATNYATFLAAQVKLAYPTAVLADQVAKGTVPVAGGANVAAVVSRFLSDNQSAFAFGAEPVDAYINRTKVAPPTAEALAQIKRIQRVYQLTTSDDAMTALLNQGIDSAYAITRYDEAGFTIAYSAQLGGDNVAAAIHDRAKQIYNSVLNVAVSYGVSQRSPSLPGGSRHDPNKGGGPANAAPSLPEATLQTLFGSRDYCSCSDCSSLLSPAAYFVDLLRFLNPTQAAGTTPQTVLFGRRPDLQHLALSCSNTNTALPYIDLVNETLEAYVAGNLSFSGYQGFDTSPDITSAELIAAPQNADDAAYAALETAFYPAPLPFNRSLELLRRQLQALNVSLPETMTRLRASDKIIDTTTPMSYGWSDILIEQLGISREEYRLFTDTSVELGDLYGLPNNTALGVLQNQTNLKQFSARTAVTYIDLVAILKTQFVNPGGALIERVEALGVGFAAIAALKTASAADIAAFKANLPAGLDYAQYGGTDPQAVVDWLTGPNYNVIMGLITITSSAASGDDCSGTNLSLAYANPDPASSAVSSADFTRLIRFIRLWRKLQSLLGIVSDYAAIHATDAVLAAFYPAAPPTPEAGFRTALQRAGFVVELLRRLGLDGGSLIRLLACWAPIDSIGKRSLYASLFLTPAILQEDLGSVAATVFPPLTQGDQLVTTIEGVPIIYTVLAADVADPAQAAKTVAVAIAAQINGTATQPPATSVYSGAALNARFHAKAQDAQVVITAGFNMQWTSNPAGGLISPALTDPTDQSGTVTATASGQTFNVTIDTVSITYTAVSGDDVNAVARNLAAAINATTTPDPYCGLPLNSLLAVSAQGATIHVVTAGAGAPFSFACEGQFAVDGSYTACRLAAPFADNGYGAFLSDPNQTLLAHEPVVCAACGLTGVEFAPIFAALGYDAGTVLSLDSLSAVFRYGWLAHTLGLSVQEFLALRSFSGLDPFALLDPSNAAPAEPPAIRFVRLVQSMQREGLAPAQALYLLWNQDPTGTLAPNEVAVATLAQSLRTDFVAVQAQFTVPENPSASDAQQLMALVYSATDTAFFFSLLNQTFSVSTPFSYVSPLLPTAVSSDAGGLLTYDATAQTLGLRGSLTNAQVTAVGNDDNTLLNPVNTLTGLWAAAVNPFFAKYPELQPLYQTYVGAIDTSGLLSAILPTLVNLRKSEQAQAEISGQIGCDASFAAALLQSSAILHADADVNQPAVADLNGLEIGGLTAVIAAGPETVAGPVAYGPAPVSAPFSWPAGDPVSAGGAVSGSWTGFITPPQTGDYDFAVITDTTPGVTVSLLIDGEAVTTTSANGIWASQTPITLVSGKLTSIDLSVGSLMTVVALGWRNSPGLGWTAVPAAALYPKAAVASLAATYGRFLKAVSLSTALSLTADETAWLATDPNVDPGWLNDLVVAPNLSQPGPAAAGLTPVLTAVLDFARLKASLSPNDQRLLNVLQDPIAVLSTNAQGALLSLTGWSLPALNALLERFFGDTSLAPLANIRNFARVFDAVSLVNACRVPAVTLLAAVSNAPSPTAIGALQSALRASYSPADWSGVVQPINDDMRRRQRDALVAWILQGIVAADPNTAVTTADDLYDLFLIDPSTQPAVLTSRIRLALSAVQLFVERIFRGLEAPAVLPGALDSSREEWPAMKRYRIWQANREVFLWPENWLDYPLRDDQSPIFQDTMNSLLQGDITDDAATSAYLDYLSGLAEVAKLEPCGIYYVPASTNTSGVALNEAAYVVARSFGAHRKYYFRRLQAGAWSPWAQVQIECEDMPITPIVWNGRLFLFWLKVQKDSTSTIQSAKGTGSLSSTSSDDFMQSAANLANNALNVDQSVSIQATLWWVEYYNGKWQPPRSSDPGRPTTIGPFRPTGPYTFDAYRDQICLVPACATGQDLANYLPPGGSLPTLPADALILAISTPQEPFTDRSSFGGGGWGSVGVYGGAGFLLLNTHSVPTRLEDLPVEDPDSATANLGAFLDLPASWRVFNASGGPGKSPQYDLPTYSGGAAAGTLTVDNYGTGQVGSFQIMNYKWLPRTVDVPPVLPDGRTAPFLYEDRLSVFYVTAVPDQITFPLSPIFGVPSRISPFVSGLQPVQFHPSPAIGLRNTVVLPNAGPVSFNGIQVLPAGGQFTSAEVVKLTEAAQEPTS
ncbi:MAG TPA: neuraminidase-like domain-containing protein [Acidobacteriaceae bacterium]|nr:neuraminidase-like domain-containing protein [Acidobacteriaceae bacterium]